MPFLASKGHGLVSMSPKRTLALVCLLAGYAASLPATLPKGPVNETRIHINAYDDVGDEFLLESINWKGLLSGGKSIWSERDPPLMMLPDRNRPATCLLPFTGSAHRRPTQAIR